MTSRKINIFFLDNKLNCLNDQERLGRLTPLCLDMFVQCGLNPSYF